jgi:hypothetical protein
MFQNYLVKNKKENKKQNVCPVIEVKNNLF